jgi:hypothetical protein
MPLMNNPDDIATLRTHLAAARRTLAALLAQPVPGDATHAQRIAAARAEITDLTGALRAWGSIL